MSGRKRILGGGGCHGLALSLVWFAVLGLWAPAASAESGVSPSRVKLPKGPGSLEGVGENAEININMGQASYALPIGLPGGHPGATPSLSLSYSSGSGQSIAGLGWSVAAPSIERMTSRGLPRYDADDAIAADGGSELVRLPGTSTFRARFEGSFVRYTWLDPGGDGARGHWKAEQPDGRISFYGADSTGRIDERALVQGPDGVFRWHLIETVDTLGHSIKYEYVKDGASSLVSSIGWVHTDARPRYQVEYVYEDREDQVSDGKPGFDVRLTKRLRALEVSARGQRISQYELWYEAYDFAGGQSRLSQVVRYGRHGDRPFPIRQTFEYTGALGGQCRGDEGCAPPYLTRMGAVGADFRTGAVDLVDINGDGLPDVIDTREGLHRIHVNVLAEDGAQAFEPERESAVANGGSAVLSAGHVHLLDFNGDGFSDLLDTLNAQVLINRGEGDWAEALPRPEMNLPDFSNDANLRFFDWDNDKRIDVMHSDSYDTWFYINLGDGRFAPEAVHGDSIGAGFADNGLQMADMNGDGLQDAVKRFGETGLSYKLYLGRGRWSGWIPMTGLPEDLGALRPQFLDMNGDSLSDLVAVVADQVVYALNHNGRSFGDTVRIAAAGGEALPERTAEISMRFADMNGSGSTDVVWIDPSGDVTFLELFPMRPNLMKRIHNGIGKIIDLTYGSSAQHMAADGGPGAWETRLPNPMLVLQTMDTWDTMSGGHQLQSLRYHDGYWDGEENAFRGFARVEMVTAGDDSIEQGLAEHTFDVGRDDRYRKGQEVRVEAWSDGRPLNVVENTYEECPLQGVPDGLDPPIRQVCKTAQRRTVKEDADESAWVVVEERYEHDGWGNTVRTANLGITSVGGGACAPCAGDASAMGEPCGDSCSGDETYTESDFIGLESTGGRWMLRTKYRERTFGREGSETVAESHTFYDGEPFVGLPSGQVRAGLISRTALRVTRGADGFIDGQRNHHDDRGTLLATKDAEAGLRQFEYDADGLLTTAEEVVLEGRTLRMEVEYDPVSDKVVTSTEWRSFVEGETSESAVVTEYLWDAFGRLAGIVRPGDTAERPTEEFEFDLGDPVSRIVRRVRTRSGGELDLEEVSCFDGQGRKIQMRTRRTRSNWAVAGFTVFNIQGKEARRYHRYAGDSGACDHSPPQGSRYISSQYDAQGRPLRVVEADADEFGGIASVAHHEYLPMVKRSFDHEDNTAGGPHEGTPLITRVDGLGRAVAYERFLQTGGDPIVVKIRYDELGALRGWVGPGGAERLQVTDLAKRVVEVHDPDAGTTRYKYDAVGRRIEETDGRGSITRFEYDGAGRRIASWDAADPEGSRIRWHYDRFEGCPPGRCGRLSGSLAAVEYPLDGGGIGLDQFDYDDRGNRSWFSRTLDGHTFEFHTDFDNAGRVVGSRYPDGVVVRFQVDGAGEILRAPGYIEDVEYGPRGLLGRLSFENGTATTFEYDAVSKLSGLTVEDRGGQVLQALTYQYDRQGNVLGIQDERPGGTEGGEYTYDALYRLTSASLAKGLETVRYGYDDTDNLISKVSDLGAASKAHVGELSYGEGVGPHLVTKAGDRTYDYDGSGNLVVRGQDTLSWDHLRRLTAVHRGSTTLARFEYGADHDRVKKVEGGRVTYYLTPDFEVRDGVSTTYVKVGGQRLVKVERADLAAEVLPDLAPVRAGGDGLVPDPDQRITAADAWVAHAGASGILAMALEAVADVDVDSLLAASAMRMMLGPSGERTTFLHRDHLGTAKLATDEAGRVLRRSSHHPYGTVREASHHHVADYSFAGQEVDESTGLAYFGKRYLDPVVGRWTRPDPRFALFTKDGLDTWGEAVNPLTYGGNNPILYADKDGEILFIPLLIMAAKAMATGATVGAVSGATIEAGKQALGNGGRDGLDAFAIAKAALVEGAIGSVTGGAFSAVRKGTVLVQMAKEVGKNLAYEGGPEGAGYLVEALTGDKSAGDAARGLLQVAGVTKDLGSFAKDAKSKINAVRKMADPMAQSLKSVRDTRKAVLSVKGLFEAAGVGTQAFEVIDAQMETLEKGGQAGMDLIDDMTNPAAAAADMAEGDETLSYGVMGP